MFLVGTEYTREEIHEVVGGSKQTYLPTKGGTVVAACLTRKKNPRAPEVILCGLGLRIARAGHLLSRQLEPVPVFVKIAPKRWQFQGRFKVTNSYTSGPELDRLAAGSGRPLASLSCAVVMQVAIEE